MTATTEPTAEARLKIVEWMDSPCPHVEPDDRAIAGDICRAECWRCIDAFTKERVEQAEKEAHDERTAHGHAQVELDAAAKRIASLEAELSRVKNVVISQGRIIASQDLELARVREVADYAQRELGEEKP